MSTSPPSGRSRVRAQDVAAPPPDRRRLPLAALLVATAASGGAARADDRESCGRPGLDLACATFGPGFHAVPQEPSSLRTFYVTVRPLPPGGASPAPRSVVYGGSGYTSVWGADARAGRADGSMVFWAGTAKVARLFAGRGAVAVGTSEAGSQFSYLDMTAGDGVAFAGGRDIVALGPRTTVEAHFDGRPFRSAQTVIGYDRHGATTRIVTDRPFVGRTVSAHSGTCLWWAASDGLCLRGFRARGPVPVLVDPSGALRRVVRAGGSPAAARALGGAGLAGVLAAQAGLRPTLY